MHVTIRDRFFELVGNRDLEWLEVASTLLSLCGNFKDGKSLIDRTTNMKERIPIETIQSVLKERTYQINNFLKNHNRRYILTGISMILDSY